MDEDSNKINRISIGDLDELSSALNSLKGIKTKPIENKKYLEPKLFSEALISYMKSNKWERFNDVYSKLLQKQPAYNLKKYGFKSYEYIFLCSDFIESKEIDNEIYIRHFHSNYVKKETPIKSQKAMKKTEEKGVLSVDGKFWMKILSRIISRRVRFLERKLQKFSKDNLYQLTQIINLKSDLNKTSAGRERWKIRHDSLKKQMREEENLSKDSLVNNLRKKNNNLENENKNLKKILESAIIPVEHNSPKSVSDVIKTAQADLSSLYIFDDAVKSARKSPYHDPEKILDALRQMDENAKQWFLMKPGTGTYESLLRGNHGLNVAESDSEKREFGTINKKGEWIKIGMKAHIKFGVQVNPQKTLRIYYLADRENQKICIGWCGKHL